MITCQLTKLEVALDHLRKAYPKLKPADAALLTTALSVSGRHALALYDGAQYQWPDDYDKLCKAMVGQLEMVQEGIDNTTPKRVAKSAPEEEPVMVSVGLMPNLTAGEELLTGREDLKTKLGDILKDGVEFSYATSDIMWQWALDRVNWNTVCGKEMSRRIKLKASFTEGAVGIEMGTAGPKKRPSRAKAAAVVEADAPEVDVPAEIEADAENEDA